MVATTVRRSRLTKQRRLERLELIKERYRKLVLEPKREIALEIASESGDESGQIGYVS